MYTSKVHAFHHFTEFLMGDLSHTSEVGKRFKSYSKLLQDLSVFFVRNITANLHQQKTLNMEKNL